MTWDVEWTRWCWTHHEEHTPRTENLIKFARRAQETGRSFQDAHAEIIDMVPEQEFQYAWAAANILLKTS